MMNVLAALLTYSLTFPAQQDISINIVENVDSLVNLVFIAPHENESVANDYLRKKIETEGGKFIELRQRGERLILIKIKDSVIKIDPNRIFTSKGRQATLKKLNPTLIRQSEVFQQALLRTRLLAEFLLKQLHKDSNKPISWVAMHNNTNGYTGDEKGGEGTISIIRYRDKLATGSQFLSKVNQATQDEDDLFYVTNSDDFDRMKKDGWNTVLENPVVKTDVNEDDGSLSVLANKLGIRYINIEAERKGAGGGEDHLVEKRNMIDYIYSISGD